MLGVGSRPRHPGLPRARPALELEGRVRVMEGGGGLVAEKGCLASLCLEIWAHKILISELDLLIFTISLWVLLS